MAHTTYETVFSGILAGEFVQTVMHWDLNEPGSPEAPFQVAKDLGTSLASAGGFIDKFTAALPTDYTMKSVRTRRVSDSGGPTHIVLQAAINAPEGQRAGDVQAAQVCPMMIWIPTTSPDKTGRTFMPGASEADIDEMQISSDLITALEDMIGGFIAGGTTDVLSIPYVGCIWRRGTSAADVVADGYVSPRIGTQRRRLVPV